MQQAVPCCMRSRMSVFPEPDQPAADSSTRRRTDFHGSDALAVAGGLIGWNCSRSIFKILFIFLHMGVLCLRFVQKYVKRNKGEVKIQSFLQKPLVNVQHLYEQGYPLPGPEHTRRLSFNTYSDLEGSNM